jgi:hypothetical protein
MPKLSPPDKIPLEDTLILVDLSGLYNIPLSKENISIGDRTLS